MSTIAAGLFLGMVLVSLLDCVLYAENRRLRLRNEQLEDMLGTGDERVRREAAARLRMKVRENAGFWDAAECAAKLDAANRLERGASVS